MFIPIFPATVRQRLKVLNNIKETIRQDGDFFRGLQNFILNFVCELMVSDIFEYLTSVIYICEYRYVTLHM
jgi:hypothetical protein